MPEAHTEQREQVAARDEAPDDEERLRFDDPDWDDEFCTWLDNGLRTCCG